MNINKKQPVKRNLRLSALPIVIATLAGCSERTLPVAAEIVSNEVLPAVSFVVIDTQQDACFDNVGAVITCPLVSQDLYGQDAQFTGIQPSYTDNGNKTVSDNNTGIVWQKTPDYKHYSHDDAIRYCENLTLASYSDWRLPTIKELFSIADFRGEIVNPRNASANTPYIDTNYFDFQYDRRRAYIGQYWSITKYTQGPVHNTQNVDAAFGFNFADGHLKAYETGYVFGTKDKSIRAPGNFVRCARGEENIYGVNEFVANGDGSVTDKATNLMWQSADDGIRRNWQESLAYAKNSKLSGYADWRLPNIKELHSIVKYHGALNTWPAIDTAFFTLSGDNSINNPSWVWSSTTQGDFKYTATYIAFSKAYSKKNSSATQYYDWHGAGAQRSDPKSGDPADYDMSSENATDLVMTKNYTLLVRTVK